MQLNARAAVSHAGRPGEAPPFVMKLLAHHDARRLGCLLSDGRVRVYDMPTLGVVGEVDALRGCVPGGDVVVRDAVFMPSDPALLWTARSDGEIACWDTRRGGGPVRTLRAPLRKGADAEYAGPFALAVNAGGDVLAVGVAHEVHLWDLRAAPAPAPLGVYASAHTHTAPSYGTVRALAWHPCVPHTLLSGGDDGLVNVFNTAIAGEDDALVCVLSVGAAVASMGFFGPSAAYLWVTSEFDGLSLWNVGSAERVGDFPALRMQFLDAGLPVCYLAGCHYHPATQQLGALAGGHDGSLAWCHVTPTAVTVASFAGPSGGDLVCASSSGRHANTVRAALWAWVEPVEAPAAAGSHSSPPLEPAPRGTPSASCGLLLFTGDEDGRLVQWADPPAGALLQRRPLSPSGTGGGLWRLRSECAYAAPASVDPTMVVNGITMRLPAPAGGLPQSPLVAGGRVCDADAFGRTAADPTSDADESVPLGAEAALIIQAGGAPSSSVGGRMDDDEGWNDDAAAGAVAGASEQGRSMVALGKRRPVSWGEAVSSVLQAPDATKRTRGEGP